MKDQEWAALLRQAYDAGLAKGRTVEPREMTVVMPDLLSDEADEGAPREVVEDGPSGGAAVEFSSDGSPEAEEFLRWLQRERPSRYPPPIEVTDVDDPAVVMVYIGDLGPSADANIAAAKEMARRLQGNVPGLTVEARPQLS